MSSNYGSRRIDLYSEHTDFPDFEEENFNLNKKGYLKRMRLAEVFEKRIVNLQRKLESYECEEPTELDFTTTLNSSNYRKSSKDNEFKIFRRKSTSSKKSRNSLKLNEGNLLEENIIHRKRLQILQELVHRYEKLNLNQSASEVGLREYKLKMRRSPGFYVNIFGPLTDVNFLNLIVVLYERVEESLYDDDYSTKIHEIDKKPEKIFALENKILDREEEIEKLKEKLKSKENFVLVLMEQKVYMSTWLKSCILALGQILNSKLNGNESGFNLQTIYEKIFEFNEILEKFVNQTLNNVQEDIDEVIEPFLDNREMILEKINLIEEFCGDLNSFKKDFEESIAHIAKDKKKYQISLEEIQEELEEERRKNQIKSKRIESIMTTFDGMEMELKRKNEEVQNLREKNEIIEVRVQEMKREFEMKEVEKAEPEEIFENIKLILRGDDFNYGDVENKIERDLYEVLDHSVSEIQERKKTFLLADAIRTEEILSYLEGQMSLTKALNKLGSLPASISLIRDQLQAKRQILQDSIQENKEHLIHLKQLSATDNNFFKDYMKQKNQRAIQLQKDKENLEAELESMKMCLETTNLENETLRFKMRNQIHGSEYKKKQLMMEKGDDNFNVGVAKGDLLGMIMMQSKMLEHQYGLLN